MNEFAKCYETLRNLCDILNAHSDRRYSVTDWAFGFILFEGDKQICNGNFANVAHFLTGLFA